MDLAIGTLCIDEIESADYLVAVLRGWHEIARGG
jgi:hypothetical protein